MSMTPFSFSNIISNRELIQKGDLQYSALATGGALVPGQAAEFIRLVVKQGVLTKMSTVRTMNQPKYQIPKARFGSRVLHAGRFQKALPLASRSAPDLTQIELDVKLFKAEVRLGTEILEDSVERSKFAETVMSLMAEAVGRDIDEIALQSDTTSADVDLAEFDGLLTQASSNIVIASSSLNKSVMRDMQKSMPSEFLRNKPEMRYLTSVDAEIDYRDSLANRATSAGDVHLLENPEFVKYGGIPVVPLHMMPENLGVGTNETNCLLLEPKQINFGFQRHITFEMAKDVSAGEIMMVLTCRWDVKYEHEPAVVKATEITVS